MGRFSGWWKVTELVEVENETPANAVAGAVVFPFLRDGHSLAWLGLAWLGLAWLGLAWLGLAKKCD